MDRLKRCALATVVDEENGATVRLALGAAPREVLPQEAAVRSGSVQYGGVQNLPMNAALLTSAVPTGNSCGPSLSANAQTAEAETAQPSEGCGDGWSTGVPAAAGVRDALSQRARRSVETDRRIGRLCHRRSAAGRPTIW